MLSRKIVGLACGRRVFCLMAPVAAQPFDKCTLFTFSGPVPLPGRLDARGEILFRLADTLGGSNVVQVLNADGT